MVFDGHFRCFSFSVPRTSIVFCLARCSRSWISLRRRCHSRNRCASSLGTTDFLRGPRFSFEPFIDWPILLPLIEQSRQAEHDRLTASLVWARTRGDDCPVR
jgi:hypothetical protein